MGAEDRQPTPSSRNGCSHSFPPVPDIAPHVSAGLSTHSKHLPPVSGISPPGAMLPQPPAYPVGYTPMFNPYMHPAWGMPFPPLDPHPFIDGQWEGPYAVRIAPDVRPQHSSANIPPTDVNIADSTRRRSKRYHRSSADYSSSNSSPPRSATHSRRSTFIRGDSARLDKFDGLELNDNTLEHCQAHIHAKMVRYGWSDAYAGVVTQSSLCGDALDVAETAYATGCTLVHTLQTPVRTLSSAREGA